MTEETFLSTTRTAYNTVAASYAEVVPSVEEDHPVNRAVLTAFADLVRAAGAGPVADIGCGTGRVTAYLDKLGLDVSGIDLSPEMLAMARRDHPELRFTEGSILALDLPDAGLAGVVAWYSVIHMPTDRLPLAFSECYRVLAPGGYLQLAFHVGDQRNHRTQGYGHDGISLDVYRLPVERICSLLKEAGFALDTKVVREADGTPAARVPQAYLLAQKPAGS
ncbi:class I SAM-dependent methyltransferase [Amycolatopsis taiwanensis]|uniref:class I SAM-dependent methyltransferase n=1 Tax=Amycolatopsis taiwanensis TaxID=342230 RepID=UPI000484128D|nr:class I SAM-dependent methyltransferase [Amycolatopsis taiwanensis]